MVPTSYPNTMDFLNEICIAILASNIQLWNINEHNNKIISNDNLLYISEYNPHSNEHRNQWVINVWRITSIGGLTPKWNTFITFCPLNSVICKEERTECFQSHSWWVASRSCIFHTQQDRCIYALTETETACKTPVQAQAKQNPIVEKEGRHTTHS